MLNQYAGKRIASIKYTERCMVNLSLVMKYAGTYRQLRTLYDKYCLSRNKEKFFRGHESEIILFEAAARELKTLGAVPLPSTESMKAELAYVTFRKEVLYDEYTSSRNEAKEHETIKQNMDALLSVPVAHKREMTS